MNRIRTTRRAALSLAFLTLLSTTPALAGDGGGSQGSGGGKAAATAPASPVATIIERFRALFGL